MSEKIKKENNIFSDLANPLRLQILHELNQKPMKVSKLSGITGMTIQALQRHMDRLFESGLVHHDADGNVSISSVGIASLEQIPSFTFLSKFRNYFKNHTFDGIPKKLIQMLGDLNNCEFIADPMQGWQQSKIFVESSRKFLYGITSVQPIEFFDTAKDLLKNGVQIKMVYAESMLVAKGYGQKRQESGWIDAMNAGQAQERFTRYLPLMTGVSDKGAQLIFASKKTGQIDSNALFYSEHPDFRNWCLDLFNYYWDEVEKVSPSKLQEI